tara:strand:+ start:53 stop:460 length:408 start_codon:yes stop_codon:yes gene_type:complete
MKIHLSSSSKNNNHKTCDKGASFRWTPTGTNTNTGLIVDWKTFNKWTEEKQCKRCKNSATAKFQTKQTLNDIISDKMNDVIEIDIKIAEMDEKIRFHNHDTYITDINFEQILTRNALLKDKEILLTLISKLKKLV